MKGAKTGRNTYNLFAAPKDSKFPESDVKRRTSERAIFISDNHNVDGSRQRSRVDFTVKTSDVRHQAPDVVHTEVGAFKISRRRPFVDLHGCYVVKIVSGEERRFTDLPHILNEMSADRWFGRRPPKYTLGEGYKPVCHFISQKCRKYFRNSNQENYQATKTDTMSHIVAHLDKRI